MLAGPGKLALVLACLAALGGCRSVVDRPEPRLYGPQAAPPVGEMVPTEKDRTTLPTYVVEPPDILLIDIVRLVPKPPYHILPADELQILTENLPDSAPVDARVPGSRGFFVDPGGNVDLGPRYGKANIGGLTVEEATEAIKKKISEVVRDPEVSVNVVSTAGLQPISGEHLVSPDGYVNLGTYGLVYVAGLSLEEVKAAIEAQLENYLDRPQVAVSVFTYNSKTYYVITEGSSLGDAVARLPITGNETVLDAVSQINGLSRISSKNIWIARPAPSGAGCDVILPVNWREITKGGATATNYQILPGDRLFIAENKLIALDTAVNQVIAPFERIFGFSLLGTQAIQTINRFPLGISGLGSGF